ncbi:tetratricopeptide repeat protein [Sporosarcina sp. Marseille-Q4063]|uniref:tetratricopeptide repeat protein n=1 Tax=Sporosarcina sp. Marseille-Q4063 TaxID=2810514 RepID=UPI001BAE8214|nr:tetratricopeptide repeat protein [Sporosarcina sp. Marseille-Q4063]QUW20276.1 tetratricopeptide repeat protein [Sporosarcina sp. Marseille-Q4063]
MQIEIDKAIEMRKTGKQKESNELLIKLVDEYPNDAFINYQCAWSFDVLGLESKAVSYYENAIQLGLSGKDLEGAIIGLGSTYRTLGEYAKSEEIFQKGIDLYPNNEAIKVFYAMTLYNLKEHGRAMELLLNSLIETTTNEEILDYKKAIGFYSDKLDQTWT